MIGKMDDDSLYVVLKVYGQFHRNERERPEEKSSGRFCVIRRASVSPIRLYNPAKVIDIFIK